MPIVLVKEGEGAEQATYDQNEHYYDEDFD